MRKFILTFSVTLVFLLYVVLQRQNHSALSQSPSLSANDPLAINSQPPNITPGTPPQAYKDGSYTGSSADAYYGNVQVKAVVQGGKLTDVQLLDYPHDRQNSQRINSAALPQLVTEAIQTQTANVDIVSGATDTSQAFQQSLLSALSQAL